jgi:hypothetical protein
VYLTTHRVPCRGVRVDDNLITLLRVLLVPLAYLYGLRHAPYRLAVGTLPRNGALPFARRFANLWNSSSVM